MAGRRRPRALIRKDCINGFVGAIDRKTGRNAFCEWVIAHDLRTLLVCGDCTDICVSDFVVAALSARNHGLLTARDPAADRKGYAAAITGLRIVVLQDACETFDAPGFHEREAAHHVGLWLMAARGAQIAGHWTA
ncbi:MAG: isochorismatase family protein [Myxococcales bacterium]|nr:isochorismatase family protein [Myxococcales bacterium]